MGGMDGHGVDPGWSGRLGGVRMEGAAGSGG